MAIMSIVKKPSLKKYDFQPFVSIIVPTFNEETVIKNRIDNLLTLNYPQEKYEIIIVDSGSKDKTVEIVQDKIASYPNSCPAIRLLKEEQRNGKASAINFGKKEAIGDIILVTDANCIFDSNVLKELMPHFDNPQVGAVGGQYGVLNPNNNITASTQFYWDIEYLMRKGESIIDSACTFHGEINAWRKNIVEADPRMLTEDLEMAITIRKKGYKIVYEPGAKVYEPAPSTAADQIKQRKRTSIGTIQSLFKHMGYFLLPRDIYSLVIFHSHKTLVMFSPFIMISIIVLYLLSRNIYGIVLHAFVTILIFSSLLVILMYIRSKLRVKETTGNFKVTSILNIIQYVLLNEYLIMLAWKDFLFGKYSVLWEKATTTR